MTRAANLAEAAGSGFAFRNRIINGDMRIDQRNAGAGVSVTGIENYVVDRWRGVSYGGNPVTFARSTVAPTGFTYSFGATNGGSTFNASSFYSFRQLIEGFNIADIGLGTAAALPFTISFWARSSVTGTYVAAVLNGNANLGNRANFTINAANTWEYKTVTFSGATSGTWLTDNQTGMYVDIVLSSGSSQNSTPNAWTSGALESTSSASNAWAATNGATFYITGVQLEKGATATPFENRPYGTELALCQRYFESSWDIGSAVGTYGNTNIVACGGGGGTNTTSFIGQASVVYKTTKRSTPTLTIYDTANPPNSGKCTRYTLGTTTSTNETVSIQDNKLTGFNGYSGSGTSAMGIVVAWKSEAEL